jgi:aminopeptidase N
MYSTLASLGLTRKPELIKRTLDVVNSGELSWQYQMAVINSLISHRAGVEAAWIWLQENWDTISRRTSGFGGMAIVVQLCTKNLSSRTHIEEVKSFFKEKSTKVSGSIPFEALILGKNY